jgi:23S rRNA (cytosine1962-C5)-methyltransferase
VFADVLQDKPKAHGGTWAHLYSTKKEFLGSGIYSPDVNLCFRMLSLNHKTITQEEVKKRIERAYQLKKHLKREGYNNSYRLINGEGDLLPGLVIDIYHELAVIKLDGEACEAFWDAPAIAEYLKEQRNYPLGLS